MRTIARSIIEADDLAQAIDMVSGTRCAVANAFVEVWPWRSCYSPIAI